MDLLWLVRAKDYTDHEDAHVTLWRTYEWLTCEADDYPAHEELLLIGRLRAERREFGGSRRLEVRFHELDSGEVISLVENTVTVTEDEDAGASACGTSNTVLPPPLRMQGSMPPMRLSRASPRRLCRCTLGP